MNTEEKIKSLITSNSIFLFMKGSPQIPQCGFSGHVANILQQCLGEDEIAYMDVLANPDVRTELPKISNWPTFPQLFIKGELVGGCDIVTELYKNGELQKMLQNVNT